MNEPWKIRYARSGDLDIAFGEVGHGPTDLLLVPGFLSHIDIMRELPPFAGIEKLAERFRVIIFDKRGTGLSDRKLGFGSLADRIDDIRAVLDAAESSSAALHAFSEGGPLALAFAATYPDRVTKLSLFGTFAHQERPSTTSERRSLEVRNAMLRESWGNGFVGSTLIGGVPKDQQETVARFERSACTPTMVEEILARNGEIDVRPLLGSIRVPTLVIHNAHDPIVPVGLGRELAAGIPHARYIETDRTTHMEWGPMEHMYGPLWDFLGAAAPSEHVADRRLATVLFTDIVESTRTTADVGDHRWRRLMDRHDETARRQVERFHGRIVRSTGDGVIATFDGPARGIECADAMRESMGDIGIGIRAGLHTGEIELREGDISGISVAIARRICDLAADGQLLASRTVKDLVIGSGIRFADEGTHTLKGVPDEWELFSVQS